LAPDTLNGRCPSALREFLEVRGLGVLNIRAMFGDSAIKPGKNLSLIIHLKRMSGEELRNIDRLQGSRQSCTLLEVDIPQVTLPVAPGHNLAVLAEGAARNHILALSGYDAAEVFMVRQRQLMEAGGA
ncbi:MAG: HPr(Ser) kinase/phosphatase, partial [Gammaproteobacteria bacterium]